MRKTLRLSSLVVIVLWSAVIVRAQDAEFQLRLAQSLEQGGEWDRAAAVYEQLHHSAPDNEVYVQGLQRSYLRLREYGKAIDLVNQQIKRQPANVMLPVSLGGIYYESGSEQQADSVWNHVIQSNPSNIGVYRVVAAEMLEHRLFPQAIHTYLEGRTATGNENAFTDDLANLYTVLQQYEAASKEFIRLLKQSPQQLPFIESRIGSFTIRDAGLQAATSVTRGAVTEDPNNITLRKLDAWLSTEGKDYASALEEYRIIDRLSNANGAELLDFSRRALQERSYLVASRGFQDAINTSRNLSLVAQARFGYARSTEELNSANDSSAAGGRERTLAGSDPASTSVPETRKGFQDVVGLYEGIVHDFPNSELAAQSFYRIGLIRMERFADYNGALDAFEKAKDESRMLELRGEASQKIAEVYVLQNNLPAARRQYQSMLQVALPGVQQQAQFRIAELDYFAGKFDSSLTELKPIVSNLTTDLTNDGLLLQYFIQENRGALPGALLEFAKADLLMRQQKYSEALAAFSDIVRSYPTALLVDDATMKIGELQLDLNRVPDALATFQHLMNDMPESILRDRAQMKIAETYDRVVGDKQKAIDAYGQILSKFPNSLYVEQARKRIRQLRGDAS